MINKILTLLDKFSTHLDNVFFPKKKKKKNKCKNCKCNCHCEDVLHAHWYDDDLCACGNCKH